VEAVEAVDEEDEEDRCLSACDRRTARMLDLEELKQEKQGN
jgi:hypothetical protein